MFDLETLSALQLKTCAVKYNLAVSLSMQTSEEVVEKMTGLQVPMNSDRSFTMSLDDKVSKLPKSIDYRRKGLVTPVKNQVRAENKMLRFVCFLEA